MEKYNRKKKFNIINSLFYNLDKFLLISNISKLRFYLNIQFIFKRLAYEKSYLIFKDLHPSTQFTISNLKKYINKNDKILDIGCGNGYIAYTLSNYVKQITSIDYDPKVIKKAKKKFKKKNIKYICADVIKSKNYLSKNFDLIICSHVIEHLEKPFNFLKTLKKFKSNIYLEVPDAENDNLNNVKKKINFYLNYTDSDHIYEFDRNYLIKKLKKNNFKIIEKKYQNGVVCLLIR